MKIEVLSQSYGYRWSNHGITIISRILPIFSGYRICKIGKKLLQKGSPSFRIDMQIELIWVYVLQDVMFQPYLLYWDLYVYIGIQYTSTSVFQFAMSWCQKPLNFTKCEGFLKAIQLNSLFIQKQLRKNVCWYSWNYLSISNNVGHVLLRLFGQCNCVRQLETVLRVSQEYIEREPNLMEWPISNFTYLKCL